MDEELEPIESASAAAADDEMSSQPESRPEGEEHEGAPGENGEEHSGKDAPVWE